MQGKRFSIIARIQSKSTMFFKYASVMLLLSSVSDCANILGIIPTPSYSHQIVFQELWRQLSLRGHNVTLVTTNPLRDPKLVNLTEIDVSASYKFFNKMMSDIAENEMTMWNIYPDIIIDVLGKISEDELSYPQMKNLIRGNGHYDVILLEYFFPELLALGRIYNCPTIIVGSFDVFTYVHTAAGNPAHPVLAPDLLSPFHGKLTLKERITSTIFSWYVNHFVTSRYFPARQRIMDKYFNISESVEELVKDVDMIFTNYHPVIRGARALGPTTISIAFERPVIATRAVPKDLKEFLDNAKEGFVYFSLGSNVKSRELNKDTFQSIIGALRELPYKVLYKYEDEDMPGKPDNVKVVTWAPQQYILRHPNIKVFVTQGGVQSMEEAIYSSVPTVVIPFFADQEQNAKLMKNRGIGLIVDRSPLRKEELKSAILEVIQNPSYKKAVTKLNELAQDEPMTGLERAIWWTEYVIRHKGAKHLRNPAADLPWYQFYLLDVLSIVAVVAIAIIALVVFLIKLLSRLFTSILLSKDSKKKKL